MLYNSIFKDNIFNQSMALKYGFKKENNHYLLQKEIGIGGFLVKFEIWDKQFKVTILEKPDMVEYLPFEVYNTSGEFVSKIRFEVDLLIDEIVDLCFNSISVRKELLRYVMDEFGTIPEKPWDNYDSYCTLKTNLSKKWYGVFMIIPGSYLGIKKNENVDVLNIKLEPDEVKKLIDNKQYFPAYHMNKKHWITILLNRNTDLNIIKELISKSFYLVEN
ncbi:MmcQ/YjbR family DNA-binding protein [Peptoniphilus mikwangii]|uniref:MmcQ/YjbR family DNA-binding protein n=1 Tax=Peptoniphilus mikwangii TaxID=1354300 RepID=UPI0004268A3A|nr:MmcQ/YjbR family DNA-binding protein [Peptoniphilus mikwangii]